MKYCINCKHMNKRYVCERPKDEVESPVFGMLPAPNYTCSDERASWSVDQCGAEARFFEAKS